LTKINVGILLERLSSVSPPSKQLYPNSLPNPGQNISDRKHFSQGYRYRSCKEMNCGSLLLSDFTAEIICLLSTRRPRKRSLNRCSSTEGRKQKWGEGIRNYAVRQKTILAQYYVATMETV
jgi:hypothetical protein